MRLATIKQLLAQTLLDRLEIELLLAKTLNQSRSYLYAHPQQTLTRAQFYAWQNLLRRRQLGEPMAYLLAEKEFWSLSLKVSPKVLIPRPETELLIEMALFLLPASQQQLLELGTGSGAIALALAHTRTAWQITALDQSLAALTMAHENKQRYQLNNIHLVASDWFKALKQQKFHAIISNPPYIDRQDVHLAELLFEPLSALTALQQGLADLTHIIEQAPQFLYKAGWLLLEHGSTQAPAVQTLLQKRGFAQISTRVDLANLPRVTCGQWLR